MPQQKLPRRRQQRRTWQTIMITAPTAREAEKRPLVPKRPPALTLRMTMDQQTQEKLQ
jgi:hypothetical protein